jgi:hypothetical protein
MQTKLTLRLEKRLIEQAKMIARQQNKSLSQIVLDPNPAAHSPLLTTYHRLRDHCSASCAAQISLNRTIGHIQSQSINSFAWIGG